MLVKLSNIKPITVALEELKAYASIEIDNNAYDGMLEEFASAAVIDAEAFCGTIFREATVEMQSFGDEIHLRGEVNAIERVVFMGQIHPIILEPIQYLSFPEIGEIKVVYTTKESKAANLITYIKAYTLFQFERNSSDKGELDRKILYPLMVNHIY